jgi:hypothetical protein
MKAASAQGKEMIRYSKVLFEGHRAGPMRAEREAADQQKEN